MWFGLPLKCPLLFLLNSVHGHPGFWHILFSKLTAGQLLSQIQSNTYTFTLKATLNNFTIIFEDDFNLCKAKQKIELLQASFHPHIKEVNVPWRCVRLYFVVHKGQETWQSDDICKVCFLSRETRRYTLWYEHWTWRKQSKTGLGPQQNQVCMQWIRNSPSI